LKARKEKREYLWLRKAWIVLGSSETSEKLNNGKTEVEE